MLPTITRTARNQASRLLGSKRWVANTRPKIRTKDSKKLVDLPTMLLSSINQRGPKPPRPTTLSSVSVHSTLDPGKQRIDHFLALIEEHAFKLSSSHLADTLVRAFASGPDLVLDFLAAEMQFYFRTKRPRNWSALLELACTHFYFTASNLPPEPLIRLAHGHYWPLALPQPRARGAST